MNSSRIKTLTIIGLIPLLLLMALMSAQAQDDDVVLPITEDVNYTVRPADTVDTIGALFDVSQTCISERNELDKNNSLKVGDVLLISISCPRYNGDARDRGEMTVLIRREVVTYEETCEGYIVQQLDTLDLIGQALDKSVEAIQIANEIETAGDLQVGQCLTIPEDAPAYGLVPALETAAEADASLGSGGGSVQGEEYVVQRGDTLDVIAQRANKSVVSIQLANRITDSKAIQPGMVIIIPEDAPEYGMFPALAAVEFTGELYTVQSSDTLDSIAEEFDVALLALQLANDLNDEADIFPGRTLLIPEGVPGFGEDAQFLGQGGGGADGSVYVVQPRDTLDVIGAFFNRDVSCLAEANGLENPGRLQPGQTLVIDESCGEYVGELIPPLNTAVSPAGDEQ